jgi:hypothetical protein
MQVARFVRTSGLLLALGLAGLVSGCGLESQSPLDQQRQNQIKESKKTAHRQSTEDSKRARQEAKQTGAMRKGARRGPVGG